MVHIRQAFEALRDDGDGTTSNEVLLAKLARFPFFTKQDLAKLPGSHEVGYTFGRGTDRFDDLTNLQSNRKAHTSIKDPRPRSEHTASDW